MTAMRVVADRERCCSAGRCVDTAADLFDQEEEDGRVVVLADRVPAGREEDAREAVELCPSRALRVEDDAADPGEGR